MQSIELYEGDCITIMKELINKNLKVDLVLTDIPYGTTKCKWDSIIPFNQMWDCLNKITHNTTPICLFGKEPFSSNLRLSNVSNFKYDWVWNKENSTNFMLAKKRPLNPLELISVFYKKQPTYNPQRRPKTITYDGTRTSESDKKHHIQNSDILGNFSSRRFYEDDGTRYPIQLITFNSQSKECNNSNRVHPTQKPVELLEYLIKTYTNPGDTVLDFTMGSGSTGVACKNLSRNFVGIELDHHYFEIAKERIEKGV